MFPLQTPTKGRRNIRQVMKDNELAEKTRKTAKAEEARKKRIAERQALVGYKTLFCRILDLGRRLPASCHLRERIPSSAS